MLKKLISRTGSSAVEARHDDDTSGFGRAKAALAIWRTTQDIGAVMAALDRLSDRRLAMIGIRRDGLYDAVTEMMDRVEGERRIADEVLALLEKAPAKGERPEPAPAEMSDTVDAPKKEERAAA